MSERKVLNKYYPPDFDPSKIPRMKLPKNRQYTVRLMAPFNMRCKTCGEYIYKGKKFNARKEDVETQDYLGIRIYRFYIKCTRCLQEISFKTDPKNTDYEIEAGATRNFMALKLAEEQAMREEEEAKEEEANNPMKLLENRTKQSKNEIELLESLEELKDLNKRQELVDFDNMLSVYDTTLSKKEREEKIRQSDEEFIKSVRFQNSQKRKVVKEEIIGTEEPTNKLIKLSDGPSTPLIKDCLSTNYNATLKSNWSKGNGGANSLKRSSLLGLVKIKTNFSRNVKTENSESNQDQNTKLSITNDNKVLSSNSLSMLGVYSDSENSSNGDND